MAVTKRKPVSKTIANTWNDVKKNVKSLGFYGKSKQSNTYSPANVKLVAFNIKQAVDRVGKARCIAMDAAKAAAEVEKSLNSTLVAVQRLKTKSVKTTTTGKGKTTKRKRSASTSTTKKRTRYTR